MLIKPIKILLFSILFCSALAYANPSSDLITLSAGPELDRGNCQCSRIRIGLKIGEQRWVWESFRLQSDGLFRFEERRVRLVDRMASREFKVGEMDAFWGPVGIGSRGVSVSQDLDLSHEQALDLGAHLVAILAQQGAFELSLRSGVEYEKLNFGGDDEKERLFLPQSLQLRVRSNHIRARLKGEVSPQPSQWGKKAFIRYSGSFQMSARLRRKGISPGIGVELNALHDEDRYDWGHPADIIRGVAFIEVNYGDR